MRIVFRKSEPKFQEMMLSSTRVYSKQEVQIMIQALYDKHLISVDFSGEYIPISLQEEIPLVSSMLVSYHNSNVRSNIQVNCL